MNTVGKHRRWILSASLISVAVALIIGAHIGYQAGLHAYDDVFLDELLAEIYYADNPVDCPPCAEGKTYEWFYVEPPADIHQPREEKFQRQKRKEVIGWDPDLNQHTLRPRAETFNRNR